MYEQFEEIRSTMRKKGYDFLCGAKNALKNFEARKNGQSFTIEEHVQALVYAMLSSQREWDSIEKNIDKINEIFHNFDVFYLKKADPEELINKMTGIACGNISIKSQMEALRPNIEQLEKIANENGSIDNYYNKYTESIDDKWELVTKLSDSKSNYKLKEMGMALVCEYLKNIGIDVAKPDRHVCRIINYIGWSTINPEIKGPKKDYSETEQKEAFYICNKIAEQYNITNIEVDAVLWTYCANGYFGVCTKESPKCSECGVTSCNFKKISNTFSCCS